MGTRLSNSLGDITFYSLMFLAVTVGWFRRDEWIHIPEEGVGYTLGIVGGVLLLFQAVYPLRKRVGIIKQLGNTKYWFMSHMYAGVLAPVLLIFHCNFKLGSMNGRVALFSMLLVALSGLVGRHLYIRIHHGLYGRRKKLEQLQKQWGDTKQHLSDLPLEHQRLDCMLESFEKPILSSSYSPLRSIRSLFFLHIRTAYLRNRARRLIRASIPTEHQAAILWLLKQRTHAALELAEFNGYERLFALWHVLHLPFFFLMFITGIFHVIAVHMY
ncbi:MAG: hypothetical protein ABW082_14430 [Sedimenticola sp.]